jgi:hypothetical protein
MEPALRAIILALAQLADRVATFDGELSDDTAPAAYKTAVRGRIKTALTTIRDAINAILAQLP